MNKFIMHRRTAPELTPVKADPANISKGIPSLVESKLEKELTEDKYVTNLFHLSRPPKNYTVTVGTTPTRIIVPPHEWPYLLINPSSVVGLTNNSTVFSGTVIAAGNTQSSPIGVANFLDAHLFLKVTAVTGTWDFFAQTLIPGANPAVPGNWIDYQLAFPGVNTTGALYANIGSTGLVTDFAIRWNPTAAGSITFTMGLTLKNSTTGTSVGTARTIFIGGQDVNTNSGLPLFESDKLPIHPGRNVTLYAIASVPLPLKIFRL